MFGIGMQEIIVILVIALVVIGPKKLPEVAKALGKGYGEFRRAFEDMRSSINVDINAGDRSADEAERLQELKEKFPPPVQKPSPAPPVEAEDASLPTPEKNETPTADPYQSQVLPAHDPIEEEETGDSA